MTLARKTFTGLVDEIAAQRAEHYIRHQPKGALTWPDQATVSIHACVRNGSLRVRDKIGEPNGPALRYIELRRGDRLLVTFVYNHYSRELMRTF